MQHLCQVVLAGGLLTALSDLKAVLLLGRGELYHALLVAAQPLLDGPVNQAASE